MVHLSLLSGCLVLASHFDLEPRQLIDLTLDFIVAPHNHQASRRPLNHQSFLFDYLALVRFLR